MAEYTHGGDIRTARAQAGREVLDFSANLNPLGMPAGVRRAAEAAVAGAIHYPDPFCRELTAAIAAHERQLIRRLGEGLSRLPGVQAFLSPDPAAQAGVLSFRAEGRDCEELGEALGRRDIALRAGLHCAPLAHQTAGTLDTGTLRASVSAFNTPGEIARFLRVLEEELRA